MEADAELVMALEESYRANTGAGRLQTEEEQMRQAMQLSAADSDRLLRAQQDAEFEESAMMDQIRDAEEESRRLEEERHRKLAEEERLRQEAEEKSRAEAALARSAALPAEPADDDPEKISLAFRLPGNVRKQRNFRKSELLQQLFDFVDSQLVEAGQSDWLGDYTLISTFPKAVYERKPQTLADAKLQNQTMMMVERVAKD